MSYVLVIDDHPDIRTLVQAALADVGAHRVTCAATGDEALPILDRDPPDVVVLDVVMPGISGIELAAHLMKRAIPVVLMSGEPTTLATLSALAGPHLQKPFRLEQLHAEIRAATEDVEGNLRAVRSLLDRLLASGDAPADLAQRLREIIE